MLLLDVLKTIASWFSPGFMLGLVLVPSVINQRKSAVSTIAWVLALLAIPYLGVLIYLTIGDSRFKRRLRRRRRAKDALGPRLAEFEGAGACGPEELAGLPELSRSLCQLTQAAGSFAMTRHNRVRILDGGQEKFPALMKAIEEARAHIHLEYYIFEADETGAHIRDLLTERARQGVQVRVLWDAVGSYSVATGFFDGLEAVGGKAASFLPLRLTRRRFEVNFRNHRKIAVIDGRVGFCGGMNIGDEYRGWNCTPWRDVHLEVEGPSVRHLQETFAEDWFFATGEELINEAYFPAVRRPGDELVQILISGPDQDRSSIHEVLFAAIAQARERVLVMTPYFVPDESLLMALSTTARRGVDVRLLLPSHSDQTLALFAGRSFYEGLLEAGVRIFEHSGGILHGKVMSVDRHFAIVGTANMDERSFFLNFEVNALLYSTAQASRIEALVREDMDRGQEITLAAFKRRPYRVRLAENACRLLSPLL